MTTMRYEAGAHRLRIEGDCRESDYSAIRDALDTVAAQASDHLIIDLTAVTRLDQSVANGLVAASRKARLNDRALALVRKHGTTVDAALRKAEGVASGARTAN